MKKIAILLVLFNISLIYSQNLPAYTRDNSFSFSGAAMTAQTEFSNRLIAFDEFIKRLDQGIDFKDVKSYKGTPYSNPDFQSGNIYENTKLLASNVALRYNVFSDEIEVKESLTTDDDEAKMLPKSLEIFVKIKNTIFIFAPYQGGIEKGGYFQVLFEGNNYNLYKKNIKKFTPAKKATTSITTNLPASFKDKPVYYIVTKQGKFYELPESKKKKLKIFGTKQNEIKKYVKENNLNLKDEDDLLKVITYFDNFKNAKE